MKQFEFSLAFTAYNSTCVLHNCQYCIYQPDGVFSSNILMFFAMTKRIRTRQSPVEPQVDSILIDYTQNIAGVFTMNASSLRYFGRFKYHQHWRIKCRLSSSTTASTSATPHLNASKRRVGRIILVRHGQSIWNVNCKEKGTTARFTGWADIGLILSQPYPYFTYLVLISQQPPNQSSLNFTQL